MFVYVISNTRCCVTRYRIYQYVKHTLHVIIDTVSIDTILTLYHSVYTNSMLVYSFFIRYTEYFNIRGYISDNEMFFG